MLAGLLGAGAVIALVSCLVGSVVGIPLRGEPAPDVTVKVTVSPSPVYVTSPPAATPDGVQESPADGTEPTPTP
ncbi:hypothetical protein SAMN05443668_104222 [Cryptosporangium aurantiacum]|uniref:Uncharacterized protein n=2 Tax=Cryptosporangium aurantiacum TaxID=134849 RepID=A0A1M7Q7F6_9ACTN|nr:hypothetical protein SAMN05443668_104222 [Cryptosporangium aurantiacum]